LLVLQNNGTYIWTINPKMNMAILWEHHLMTWPFVITPTESVIQMYMSTHTENRITMYNNRTILKLNAKCY